MTTITRERPKGFLTPNLHDQFAAELTAATGVFCLGAVVNETPAADPVNDDRLDIVFDGSPVEATVDAAIAAFPSFDQPVDGSFAAVSGGTYYLGQVQVRPGQSVALDIHLHVALGAAADFEPVFLDTYACVYRRTTGDVRGTTPNGSRTGNIPSLAVLIVGAAEYADVYVTLRATGTLTLISKTIEEASRGSVPA